MCPLLFFSGRVVDVFILSTLCVRVVYMCVGISALMNNSYVKLTKTTKLDTLIPED